jgi:protein-L-isoaspartate O-methyltransferase
LTDQLAPGGAIVIPVGPAHGAQDIRLVHKDALGKLKESVLLDVVSH